MIKHFFNNVFFLLFLIVPSVGFCMEYEPANQSEGSTSVPQPKPKLVSIEKIDNNFHKNKIDKFESNQNKIDKVESNYNIMYKMKPQTILESISQGVYDGIQGGISSPIQTIISNYIMGFTGLDGGLQETKEKMLLLEQKRKLQQALEGILPVYKALCSNDEKAKLDKIQLIINSSDFYNGLSLKEAIHKMLSLQEIVDCQERIHKLLELANPHEDSQIDSELSDQTYLEGLTSKSPEHILKEKIEKLSDLAKQDTYHSPYALQAQHEIDLTKEMFEQIVFNNLTRRSPDTKTMGAFVAGAGVSSAVLYGLCKTGFIAMTAKSA